MKDRSDFEPHRKDHHIDAEIQEVLTNKLLEDYGLPADSPVRGLAASIVQADHDMLLVQHYLDEHDDPQMHDVMGFLEETTTINRLRLQGEADGVFPV